MELVTLAEINNSRSAVNILCNVSKHWVGLHLLLTAERARLNAIATKINVIRVRYLNNKKETLTARVP